jgi:hypothetical protein
MASAEVVFENLDLPPRFDPALIGPPAGDSILAVLPASAAEKLRGFQASRDDLRAVLRAASDDFYEAQQDRRDAERRLRDLQAMPRASISEMAQARTTRDRLTDQLSRIQDRIDARRARADHLAELVANLERWVRSLTPGTPIRAHEHPAPKLAKGETLPAAVERVRTARARLAADFHATRSAPIPSAAAKAIIRAQVDALAQRGRPDVFPVLEGGQLAWPVAEMNVPTVGAAVTAEGRTAVSGLALYRATDTFAVLAWLHRDRIIAALEAEVDSLANDSAALDDATRAAREAELLARILEAERDEEALIVMGEAQGTEVARRREADPRAVLGVIA